VRASGDICWCQRGDVVDVSASCVRRRGDRRSETADLRIDHGAVSRQHARLALEGEAVSISDLGSHNGTYVNKVRLIGRRTLQPNDVITIHGTTLVFHATSSGPRPRICSR